VWFLRIYICKKKKLKDMKTTMQENRKMRTIGSAGKRLFIVLFSLGLAYGASAQRGGHGIGAGGGGFHGGYYGHAYYAPAYVGVGYGYGLGWGLGLGWGYGYPGWYGPWYAPYPPYYYGRGPMPSQLNEQINGIKSDYKAQIKDVKHDKTLPRSEKDQRVNQLEKERDAAITQARHDYYNRSRANYNSNGQRQQNNGNGQQQNNAQPQNNGQLQPGPTNGSNGSSSSNDADHPEYSQKAPTNSGQQ
jgi:hypothetical protein